MPELAEVKIMSEYINEVAKDIDFTRVRKNPKNKNPKIDIIFYPFKLISKTRGKEMVIELYQAQTKEHPLKRLLLGMGMSGNWVFVEKGKEPKHSQLMFDTHDEKKVLCLVDFRRFSRWKEVSNVDDGYWSDNRGPCMLTEWEDFVQNLKNNSDRKIFDKPIFELMMEQKYFNGCGNYLRAEILDRSNVNPFISSREAIEDEEFLKLCKDITMESYQLGGGQLQQWTNPYFDDKVTFKNWLQCYGKKEKIKDKKGRTFWFDGSFLIYLQKKGELCQQKQTKVLNS